MSVASILEEMAQNAGRARLVRGAIVGDAIQGLSQVPGQILADREKQRIADDQRRRQQAQDAHQAAGDARQAAADTRDEAQRQKTEQERQERGAVMAAGLDPQNPTAWHFEPAVAKAMSLNRKDLAHELIDAHDKAVRDARPKTPTELALDAANPTSPTQQQSTTALDLSRPPKAEPAPKALQSENEWQVDGKSRPVIFDPASGARYLTQDDVAAKKPIDPARLRKMPPASAIGTPGSVDNVKEAVAGMKDGTLPPQMPGRASKDYTAILAEARRQGFDLGRANLDWNATQKHVATMNGAQQLRLNQAVNALPEMLDKVDALAAQWKGGRFPALNTANLALAKGGAYGKDAASIANQLDAQIADVTADLGNVYMGGNSPTDHALGLAGKSLKADWDEKVLHDMVQLAKTNVTIRRHSIDHTGVAGASPDNPYAAPAAAAPPAASGTLISVTDPLGGVHQFPTQAAADAFKKAAGIK